jgi:hypothetical protein
MGDLSRVRPPEVYSRLALEPSRRAIVLLDRNSGDVLANTTAERLFDMSRKKLIGSELDLEILFGANIAWRPAENVACAALRSQGAPIAG